jgi:hypothetical protein
MEAIVLGPAPQADHLLSGGGPRGEHAPPVALAGTGGARAGFLAAAAGSRRPTIGIIVFAPAPG